MTIGLLDVDNYKNLSGCFPNIPLMKISAYHKSIGDKVEWYNPLNSWGGYYDKVYASKVFSFSEDYPYYIYAKEVEYGGSGYAIKLVDGIEIYVKGKDKDLPKKIEKMFPDYSIYGITDTAYGFLTKGCFRQCDFCHVKSMQGTKTHKVSDLSSFWNGQKNIVLLDPNITAFKGWKELFQQLIDSGASIDFSQGLDIRLMTEEKIEMLKKMKIKNLHFAWDRYEDGTEIVPKLESFKNISGMGKNNVTVYILTNFGSTYEQDIERVNEVLRIGFRPYVMRYDKEHIRDDGRLSKLARYCNSKYGFCFKYSFKEFIKSAYKKIPLWIDEVK